jgi:hypothetical protein
VTIEWRGQQVLEAVRGATVRGLLRGVESVKDEAVSLINTGPKTGRIYGRHQASAPGEAPAGDTGDLARRIGTDVDPATLTGSVTFSSKHARPLEYGTVNMAPRPFARVALVHRLPAIEEDIEDEIAGAMR